MSLNAYKLHSSDVITAFLVLLVKYKKDAEEDLPDLIDKIEIFLRKLNFKDFTKLGRKERNTIRELWPDVKFNCDSCAPFECGCAINDHCKMKLWIDKFKDKLEVLLEQLLPIITEGAKIVYQGKKFHTSEADLVEKFLDNKYANKDYWIDDDEFPIIFVMSLNKNTLDFSEVITAFLVLLVKYKKDADADLPDLIDKIEVFLRKLNFKDFTKLGRKERNTIRELWPDVKFNCKSCVPFECGCAMNYHCKMNLWILKFQNQLEVLLKQLLPIITKGVKIVYQGIKFHTSEADLVEKFLHSKYMNKDYWIDDDEFPII